ncbi:MAG: hypothetical protein ACKOB8_11375 [Mycobacterium sp.]
MKRPVTAFVLAVASLILSPVLVFIEITALLFAAMVIYEPTNPPAAKVLSVAFVVVVGLFASAVPVIAIITATKARAASRQTAPQGSGLATAAVVIAGIAGAAAVVSQAYVVLLATGACSLDGC